MSIHIGQIIKKVLKSKDMNVVDFAKRIHYTRGNAYKIFEKESLDTDLLSKISKVLGENLFFHYIKDSEMEEKLNEKLKSKLALKAWDDFMAKVKAGESEAKSKKTPAKSKPAKKPVKKSKK